MSLIGVDIGSSGCKVAIYSTDGSLISTASALYSVSRNSLGSFELDCHEVEQAVYTTIHAAADRSTWREKDKNDFIQAIAFASFGEAMVPIGKHGEILGPSIFALDTRRKDAVSRLQAMGAERFYKINANILDFIYSYPKLVWYQENMPDLYERIWKFLLWADFFVYRLTGVAVTNYSLASRTLLFDLWKETWSDEILEAGGIHKRILTDLVPSGIPIGTVDHSMAAMLGIPDTTLVVSGLHDQCANALGAGAIDGGSSVTGIGTVECTTFVFDTIPDPSYLLNLHVGVEHHAVPGKYVSLIYNQAGSLMSWFIKVFCKELQEKGMDEHQIFAQLAQEAPQGPTSVTFLPFVEPGGAPSFIPANRGCFLGIGATTGRGELYRAVLEGETMYFLNEFRKLGPKGLGIRELVATGGGSRDDLWLRIKADMLGLPIRRARYRESGTAGSAISAGLACGAFSTMEEAANIFKGSEKQIKPNPVNQEQYEARFVLYSAGMKLLESNVWGNTRN